MIEKYTTIYTCGVLTKVLNPDYKEPINELEIMDKINTQIDAQNAVRTGMYIVGSVDSVGNISFNSSPAVHADSATARKECKRLASLYHGKLFIFVKLAGGEMIPTASISI